ncbi:MAG: UDP-galactopyranose mutase [Acidimicrobiales bacterium]
MARIAVIGAGWTGAVVARELTDAGHRVEVLERAAVVGGHSRVETLNGVVYEPNGAHIFHTSDPTVKDYVSRFGMGRPYEHVVVTEVYLSPDDDEPRLLSWPPQVAELRELPIWPVVERELAELPPEPIGESFEEHVISLMGPTLYGLFIRDYTVKQWDRDPRELSARFAPKRVELRDDGYRRLFRDTWEFFEAEGVNSIIEAILAPVSVTAGATISMDHADDLAAEFDMAVITAPLDDFAGCPGELEWRGIEMRSRYVPTDTPDGTVTPAYVVNRPSLRVPYTRTVETKHATGQSILGTVVSEEIPGSPARHYPVPRVDGRNTTRNGELMAEIADAFDIPVLFAGRLATYRYINQDEAITDALRCATEALDHFAP